MGEKNITTQVKINGDITPDFSRDWEVEFQGEKYIMPLRQPQGAKENTSLNSTIDLTFQHWAIYQLKRWMFFTVQPVETGTAVADKYIADVILNLGDFCNLFGQVLRHYYGDTITIDLNPDWDYKQEASPIAISHSYIWDVLIKLYELFAVRWSIEPNSDNSHYVIKVGYPAEELDHIFEYGFDGGLLKVERQVQSEDIRNMLLGRGGEKNIPKYYFKKSPDEEKWRSDPDWIEELVNLYFTNLMPATFRSYVQGWKAAHISKYPGYAAVGESNAYAPWAYRKGYTDSKFDYVEYVKDDESIAKYGPLLGGLDNNEEIYPSIQGSGMDIAVDVEQILSDDVVESVENDATVSNIDNGISYTAPKVESNGGEATITLYGGFFDIPTGKYGNLTVGAITVSATIDTRKVNWIAVPKNKFDGVFADWTVTVEKGKEEFEHPELIVIENIVAEAVKFPSNEIVPISGIPEGTYVYQFYVTVRNNDENTPLDITVACESTKLTIATLDDDSWKNTFDIWVKNIWNSTKLSTETDEEYAERVWTPILGDREGGEAAVMFTAGALAISEDYEFKIPKGAWPVYDTSKSLNGESSHWRIKLAKSDADLESTGLYVPSTQRQGKAGDKFVFIGTEMTHNYVVWAETALDDWKKDQLREKKDIKPTWVVTTDRVRLNNEGKANALIQQLRIGNSLRLADKRFIQPIKDRAYETLYLQSITYTYREPSSDDAALNPDVAIVLSNEYATVANPVATMQGEISALQRQVGAISNVEQIVRAVGDRLYLRKDGISDRSLSPTQFFSLLTSGDFRAGIVGGAGWGFYKDADGNWVLEADRVNVRQEMQVNTLVINQAEGRGGMEIDTAAFMEVTRVVETSDGYVCYFDQKEGSVANLFHIDDVAYCNRWTPENTELKFYKRRVIAVGVDNITLSNTDVNGSGIPAEKDNIIHFGNYTDKTRQYVKVRDVVGGGYERYIEELNSVNAAGVEYYFVGKQAGQSRWFVGNKDLVPYSGNGDGSYIEYINRRFNLNNVTLSVNTTIGDKSIEEYIKEVSPPVEQEDIEDFVNAIVNPKLDGIQDQIDGVIETWFYNGVPTLSNYPASGWNTEALKIQHLGDLYYDNDTGTAYRFSQNADKSYYWNTITDDAITKALAAAKKAQDTADGKRRVFTAQPKPPYDEGDMWVNATFPTGTTAADRDPAAGKYHDDILRCISGRASGAAFNISDWTLASNYTDDTTAQNALDKIQTYEYLKNALLPENPTQVISGLVMSTMVSLGYTGQDGVRHTLAGMNGSWVDSIGGRTIASWWGGNAVDLFDANDNFISPVPDEAATSLVRMDGSVYWANGNVGFRADGSGWLGNKDNGIKFSSDGSMTFGSGITININSISGLGQTLTSITNFQNSLSNLLVPINSSGKEISWEEATQSDGAGGIKAKGIMAKVHFSSQGSVAAKGLPTGIGGSEGGGTSYDRLDAWTDYTADAAGWVLSAKLGYGLYLTQNSLLTRVAALEATPGLDTAALEQYLTTNNYAKLSDIPAAVDLSPYAKKADVVTALGVSGNNLTWTKNGVVNSITVPYATNSKQASCLFSGNATINPNTIDAGFTLEYYGGINAASANLPTSSGWQNALIHIGLHNNNTAAQLYVSAGSSLYFRSDKTAAWRTILDSANYASVLGNVYQAKGNYVTTDTVQTITGAKTFTGEHWFVASGLALTDPWNGIACAMKVTGKIGVTDSVKAASFIKSGGTSAQFLKADGSVDGLHYVRALDGTEVDGAVNLNEIWNNATAIGSVAASANGPAENNGRWYNVIQIAHRNGKGDGPNYVGQIALGMTVAQDSMYFRGHRTRAWQHVLTSSNYTSALDSRYVKKSGDTMTGNLSMGNVGNITNLPVGGGISWNPYVESSTDASDTAWIKLIKAGVAGGSELQIQMMNDTNDVVNINTNSYSGLRVKGSIVWNQNNDGSGSGLDADLLDGIQGVNYGYAARIDNFMVGSSRANITTAQFVAKLTALGAFNRAHWTAKCSWYYAGNDNITDSGVGNIELAGAVIEVVSLNTNEYTIRVTTSPTTANGGVPNAVFIYRNHGSGYVPNWKRLANTSDNVSSATKLAAARTLWGRPFDGTQNITGDLVNVGTITGTSGQYALAATYSDTWSDGTNRHSWYGLDHRYANTGIYSTTLSDYYGLSLKTRAGLICMTNGGKVGINTANPAYPLDVAGSAIFTNWVRVRNNDGIYFENHGGGWHMLDNAWVRLYGNKALYCGAGEVRTDAYFNREGYTGTSWGQGYGAYNVAIANNGAQTPLMVAYRLGQSPSVTGANRLFAIELLNSGSHLRVFFGGNVTHELWSNGNLHVTGSMWSDKAVSGKGLPSSSDERLKTDIRSTLLSMKMLLNAPAVSFLWRDELTGPRRAGTIAQYWLHRLPEVVYTRPDNGMYNVDYGPLAHIEVISLAHHVDDELTQLKRRVTALEEENTRLRNLLNAA